MREPDSWRDPASELRRIDARIGMVESIAVSPDDRLVAAGGNPSDVAVWDAASGQLVQRFKYATKITSLAFTSDGSQLAIAAAHGLTPAPTL